MKLYKWVDYPENPKELDIVDILTSDERSCLQQGKDGETRSFAVNYGDRIGDRSPVLRGFEADDMLYEIDAEKRMIIIQPKYGQLFYDEDKIPVKTQFVFEGTLDEVLQEFADRGYGVKR